LTTPSPLPAPTSSASADSSTSSGSRWPARQLAQSVQRRRVKPRQTSATVSTWRWLVTLAAISALALTSSCAPQVVTAEVPPPVRVRPVRARPRASVAQLKAWALAATGGDQKAALRLVAEVLVAWSYEDALEEANR
jgi:hypothetical protein